MKHVLTAKQHKEADARAISSGIPGVALILRAAGKLCKVVEKRHPENVLIMCGGGNNGGDGFALLGLLREKGIAAQAILLTDAEKLSADARFYYEQNKSHVLDRSKLSKELFCGVDTIVDAMLGTGLDRALSGMYEAAVKLTNAASAYRIAVDIPTGVSADTGMACTAFKADETVTFHALKRGLLLYPGRDTAGKVTLAEIGIGYDDTHVFERILEADDVKKLLPAIKRDSNKGDYGKALLLAGSNGFSGAALMSAGAALRGGVGLLKVACSQKTIKSLCVLPEAMTVATDWNSETLCTEAVQKSIAWAKCIGIGPGIGTCGAVASALEIVLASGKPVVIDADALNILSQRRDLLEKLHENCVLTPHVVEMQRLCGCEVEQIKSNPVDICTEFAVKYEVTLLLKGATSVISDKYGNVTYNVTGNPGLAKGGSGDVLTGIILSMLARGMKPYDAACVGAYILGLSADEALELIRERALLAGDVTDAISKLLTRFDDKRL